MEKKYLVGKILFLFLILLLIVVIILPNLTPDGRVESKISEYPEPPLPSHKYPITLSADQIMSYSPRDNVKIKISIYNPTGQTWMDTTPNIQCSDFKNITLILTPRNINPGEFSTLVAIFSIPVLPPNEYSCYISVPQLDQFIKKGIIVGQNRVYPTNLTISIVEKQEPYPIILSSFQNYLTSYIPLILAILIITIYLVKKEYTLKTWIILSLIVMMLIYLILKVYRMY